MYGTNNRQLVETINICLTVLFTRDVDGQSASDLYRAREKLESIIARFNLKYPPKVGDRVEYDKVEDYSEVSNLSSKAKGDFVRFGTVRTISGTGVCSIEHNDKSFVNLWRSSLRVTKSNSETELDDPVHNTGQHVPTTQNSGTW
jgi:hypothetical protein